MSTDADTTPTEQTILTDSLAATSQNNNDTQPGASAGPPRPGPNVTPASSSTERTVVTGPRPVQSGALIAERWRIEQCLASGGYGDVWKGWDIEDEKPVAIKILRTDAGNNDPSAIARMRQEAEILKAIDHPNIVSVFGFGESIFGHFLAMELLDGKAIDQVLQRDGPADTARAIPIVRGLLDALREAHSKQILHRDLKPENIIIVRDNEGEEVAKLLDFGIAKAHRLLNEAEDGATLVQTRAGGFMGTPRYAAPEQAVGDPCGPNIDLFALGLVIAEWLTGRMRIDGERHADVMMQLLSPDEIDISDVPYRWREWLGKMTKKNPQERYHSAAQAASELEHLVVDLHQQADFLDENHNSLTFGLNDESGAGDGNSFVETGAPLELDFERVRQQEEELRRKSEPTPAALRPFGNSVPAHQSGPLEPVASAAPRRARSSHPTEDEPPALRYVVVKILFAGALLIISFGAIALLIGQLVGGD